jgi:DNA-binding response OmpR family regulator
MTLRNWLHDRWPKLVMVRPHPDRSVRPRRPTIVSSAELVGPSRPVLRKTILMIMTDGCRMDETERALKMAGYEVHVVRGLPPALQSLQVGQPSLLIVCGLPATGTYVALRRATSVPMLVLVPGATEVDRVCLLAAGADDCQPASIGTKEVVVRSRALLRRSGW